MSAGIICIDPGLRGCGVAYFEGSKLVRADYVKNPVSGNGYCAHSALGWAVVRWVAPRVTSAGVLALIEHPRIYPGGLTGERGVDLNDLLDVVAVGAAVGACLHTTHAHSPVSIYPSQWKGTVKKSVMTARIRSGLSDDERKVCGFTNKSDDSDLLDAVGIGLWRLGRLNKKVYPGAT